MQRFKNWLITILLKKDKLVAVPESWQTEYVQLAGDKVRNKQNIAMLINEYNESHENKISIAHGYSSKIYSKNDKNFRKDIY